MSVEKGLDQCGMGVGRGMDEGGVKPPGAQSIVDAGMKTRHPKAAPRLFQDLRVAGREMHFHVGQRGQDGR